VALLVLTTIRNVHWAIAYLLIFGVGTIAGMMLITMSLASAFRLVGNTRQKFSRRLAFASGLLSLGFGLFVAYQICVVDGLFYGSCQMDSAIEGLPQFASFLRTLWEGSAPSSTSSQDGRRSRASTCHAG